jgi:multidrug efflux pump subunit AcrB
MRAVVAWFAENHVAANLLMFFFLVAGIATAVGIKLEIFPEASLDMIKITVEYPGASPEEVEEGVIRRIEENIAGLTGIKRIDSTAREGLATITVEVMKDWDVKTLLDEVKAEVDRITTLPDEVEKPVIREIIQQIQVISVAVYGDAEEAVIKHLAETIKDDIINLPDITLASMAAARENEIHIEIREENLRKHGLTLGVVADIVSRNSLDLPAGRIKTDAGEILIRTKGRKYHADEYRDIPVITRPDGSRVTLADIAVIREGFADVDLFASFDGKPAIIINVFRVADQSALKVAAGVKEFVAQRGPTLPEGLKIEAYNDYAKILKSRLELLGKNLFWGLILVAILLGMFLNIRTAFWVTLGIPVSFACAVMLMPHYDISLNMLSLFAFIMVLGIVVDDAIIVGENVFSKQEAGMAPLAASIEGTLEVGRPVIFSVLTTIAAFAPLLLAGGMIGKLMRNIPMVVILVLTASLIESLFILPAHLARSKSATIAHAGRSRPGIMARALDWIIRNIYSDLATICVKWRYVTISIGVALLLVTLGVWASGKMKFSFFPKVEGDVMQCLITMPSGAPMEQTKEVVHFIEQTGIDLLAEHDRGRPEGSPPLLEYSASVIGAHINPRGNSGDSGGHLAQIWIQLIEGEIRDISSEKLAHLWRERVGSLPEVESLLFQSEIHSVGNPVEVHLSLTDYHRLKDAAEALKAELATYPGVFDIRDSFLPGKTEMQLHLKPQAETLGITISELARQVRHGFYGAEALRFQRDKNEIRVLVRYPEDERRSLYFIEQMRIRTPSGEEVPFDAVASVEMTRGYTRIERAQRLRVVKVMADVNESIANANEVRQELLTEVLPRLAGQYSGLRFAMEGEGKEQRESLGDVFKGFILALFCIYALLAIPFKSFSQPLVVMTAIPFGIVGAVWGHMLMGYNLSIISIFGIVGLSGVAVNDSLVLVHRINRLREQGMALRDAVVQSGIQRFRPVILTSLTTFAGLTPILLETSLQARFLKPMAVSIGFGVLLATGITLFLIPCGYMILEDIKGVGARMKSAATGS